METAFVSAGGVALEQAGRQRALADTLNARVGFLDEDDRHRLVQVRPLRTAAIARPEELDGFGGRRWPPRETIDSYEAAGVNLIVADGHATACFHHRLRRTRCTSSHAVHRPVADLPLEELAGKASAWGFDGLELACWGDHFDVDEALADPGPRTAAARSSTATASSASRSRRTSSARPFATRSTSGTRRSCPRTCGVTVITRASGAGRPTR